MPVIPPFPELELGHTDSFRDFMANMHLKFDCNNLGTPPLSLCFYVSSTAADRSLFRVLAGAQMKTM